MSNPFADPPETNPFADPPQTARDRRAEQAARGWRFDLRTLGAQAAAGFVTTPTDLVGLVGAAGGGDNALSRVSRDFSDSVNNTLGIIDPNWRDNTPEFVARTFGGALVGIPARVVQRLSRLTGVTRPTPTLRALEAATPITLPLNARNVALNTVGGAVVGAGVQEIVDAANASDEQQANPFADPPEARTTAQVVRDNLPLGALAILGGAGGVAAYRQSRINRAVEAARQGPAAPATATQPEVPGGFISQEAAYAMRRNPLTNELEPIVRQETDAEAAARNVLDDTATAQNRFRQAMRAGYLTEDEMRAVNAGFATNTQQAVLQDVVNAARDQGVFEGIRFTPAKQYEAERTALMQRDASTYALYENARAAGDALDDRAWYARQGQVGASRLLSGRTDDELRRVYAEARKNATVRALLDQDFKDNAAMRQIMVQAGLVTAADAQKMASVRPRYLHTLMEENTPLTRRNMTQNQEPNEVANPVLARQDAWNDVLSRAIENRQRQRVYTAVEKVVAQDANALRNFGFGITGKLADVRKNVERGAEVVPVMINGEKYGMELAPEVAQGVRTFARATVPIVTSLARLQRNATTGPLAAALGYVQAVVSAGYGATAVMLNRPRGMAGGYLDRSGRSPIVDPTFLAAQAVATTGDIYAETARAVSSELMRSIYSNGTLSRMLNATGVDARKLQAKLEDVYKQSRLAERRRLGSAGTGLTYDPIAAETLKLAELAATPEFARTLAMDPRYTGMRAAEEYARHFGRQTTPASAQRFWRLFASYLDIISDGPVSAFVMLNRDRVAPEILHGTARRLQGDPAARGASRTVQQATSVMNYSNITLQAIRQFANTAQEQPLRLAANAALISGLGAAMTVYSALMADEEEGGNRHMQALLNADGRRLASGPFLSVAGVDPVNAPRMAVEPILGAPTAIATVLLSNAIARENGITLPGIGDELEAFLSNRAGNTVLDALDRSVNPLNAPPGVSAIAQLAGGPDVGNLFSIINPRVGTSPRDVGVAGYANTRLERDPISRPVDLLMSDLFGIAGEQTLLFLRQMGYGNDLPTAAAQTFAAGAARTPGVAAIMSYTRGEPQRGMLGQQLASIEGNADSIASNLAASVLRPDVVGAGRSIREVPGTIGADRPHEDVVPILVEVRNIHNALAPLRAERSAAQQEIIRLRSQGNDPQVVNAQVNAVVERIRDYNTQMLREYLALERRLQQQYGRDIRIAQIAPLRPIDQFPMRGQ